MFSTILSRYLFQAYSAERDASILRRHATRFGSCGGDPYGEPSTNLYDQEAGTFTVCSFAPSIRSHSIIAISPKSAGEALRKAKS